MKKILSFALAALMLLSAASAAIVADDATVIAGESVLAESSILQINDGTLIMVKGAMTVAELKADFTGGITVAKADGTVKADDAAVATDDTVTAGTDVYKVMLYGDSDRNGKVNISDITVMLKAIAFWDVDMNKDSADVNRDTNMNLADVTKMLQYIAGWENISLGNVRMVLDNTPVKAENEDGTIQLYYTDMMNKLCTNQTEHTGNYAFKMDMAKNETESCQAILLSEAAREGLTAELSDFEYEFGGATLEGKLEWVRYYDNAILTRVVPRNMSDFWHHGEVPEVVLPMADSFELREGLLQHLIISVEAPADAKPGMYVATLDIKDADGKVIKTSKVYANVWDFALPDTPYSQSLFNTNYYWKNDPDYKYTYADYFEFMLDNNLSSYILPVEITDEAADAYMSDPRVTAFVIAGGGHMYGGKMAETDEQTVANFNKVMSNEDWAKKGLFYYTDEPWGVGLQDVKTTYEHLVEILGTEEGIRNITPLAADNSYADEQCMFDGIDPVAYIEPYINVWCPQSWAFHLSTEGGPWTPRRHLSKYGEFADRAKKFKEEGDELWWYVCCSPEVPYANYFSWYQGVILRVLLWQQFFNDIDGQLYYETGAHWEGISKYQFDITNGDGVLMYPGEMFGYEGPQASWRLYQVRDGWDDFDYLRIAEELCGREAVMKVVEKVTKGMLLYTEDYRVLDAARDEIMKMIVEAQTK